MQVQRDTGHHRQNKRNRERGGGTVGGGKAADGDDGGKVIKADDGMSKSGQHALGKGRRRAASHHVVRKGRRVAERQGDKTNGKTNEFWCHADFSRRASLTCRVWLDIPCPAIDKTDLIDPTTSSTRLT